MKNTFLFLLLILSNQLTAQEEINPVFKQKIYLKNLTINTIDSDFGATLFGEYLIFSSTRKSDFNSNKKWENNGQRFLNFYKGKIEEDGDVKEWYNLSKSSNTQYHESNAVFNTEKTRVYFTRNNYYQDKKITMRDDNGKTMKIALFIADVDVEGNFYNIVPFPYNSNEYSTGLPALSNDGKFLYFVSDMPGTLGKTDIFRCAIKEDGTFSQPENLGNMINTPGREMFPYIASDGYLYFSSDSRDGFGKFDIYRSNYTDSDITIVENLGEPFNSSRDDFSIIFNEDMNSGYFSSNRPETGMGDDDIYFFYNETYLDNLLAKQDSLLIQKLADAKQDVKIMLNVINEKNKSALENAKVEVIDKKTGETVLETIIKDENSLVFEAKPDQEYLIKATKPLFEDKEITINTSNQNKQIITKVIELKPETTLNSENKVVIDLNPIYFDYDSAEINSLAAEELNKVISIMLKYPTMVIEATSHTDSRGPTDYNQKLSERRAISTVNYIVNNGKIDPKRLVAIGYGEERLTNKCKDGVKCTDAEHAANRRTEFIIINIEDYQ